MNWASVTSPFAMFVPKYNSVRTHTSVAAVCHLTAWASDGGRNTVKHNNAAATRKRLPRGKLIQSSPVIVEEAATERGLRLYWRSSPSMQAATWGYLGVGYLIGRAGIAILPAAYDFLTDF
jgi:hypothetical protein